MPDGYPQKYSKFSKGQRNAHRVIYENYYGEIPKGMVIMHLCDNPKCINIKHLKMGTFKENSIDMVNKKRNKPTRETKHPNCKLLNKDIPEIKDMYKNGFTQTALAKKFGVDQALISKIINNKLRNYLYE